MKLSLINGKSSLLLIVSNAIIAHLFPKNQHDDLEKEPLIPSSRIPSSWTPFLTNKRSKTELDSHNPSQISSIEVSDHFDIFYTRLRRFSDRIEFDYSEFQREFEYLDSILTIMEQWAKREGFNPQISNQLSFTKQTFAALVASMNLMLNIKHLDTPAYRFIRDVTGRKITVLSFFDSFGGSNYDIDSLPEKISFMRAELISWESQFKFLDDVSIDIRMIFDLEVDNVNNYLEELEKVLIKEKRNMEGVKNKGISSKWVKWG